MKLRFLFALPLVLTTAAHAIQPVTWTHTTEADFTEGKVEHTVVTSLGDVKLAIGSKTLAEAGDTITVIYDIEKVGGTTYLAVGPTGALMKLDGDTLAPVVELENEQVFALVQRGGALLVAVSGKDTSRLTVLKGDTLEEVAKLPEVRYVWDILVRGDTAILATGIDGKVLAVAADGSITEMLDAEQVNVLSLAASDGAVFAGTDTDGLIYRITTGDKPETFVVFDADEPEIGALLFDRGVLYAGTADAEMAKPGRLADASTEESGRPAGDTAAQETLEGEGAEGEPGQQPDVPNVEPEPAPLEEPAPAEPEPAAPDAPEPVPVAPAQPTAEQYDALRAMMRARLDEARKSGKLQVEGLSGPSSGGRPAGATSSAQRQTQRAEAQKKDGNAVYRIDPDGFVREVFRESVMILKLVASPAADGSILALTGNEGQLYRIDPAADETAVLVDLDNEQLVAALPGAGPDGTLLIGSANPAQLVELDPRFAPTGTYTSKVLDAQQVSLFGTLTVTGSIPAGSSVTVETRSGNTADPEIAAWSPWSQAQVFMPDDDVPELQPREMKVASPPARFFQYRLTLSGDVAGSPAIEKVDATYVTPNLRPAITSLHAAYPDAKKPDPNAAPATDMNIEWEATDANTDPLIYKVEYRPAGSEKFLLLADDVTDASYTWPTRQVPDGRYVVRVTADDRPANPGPMALSVARVSDPVLVDNTPPTIDAKVAADGKQLAIIATVTDVYSKLSSFTYSLNGDEEYRPMLPGDLIFDSTSETFDVTIPTPAAGPHVVTLKATDARGNTAYKSVLVE